MTVKELNEKYPFLEFEDGDTEHNKLDWMPDGWRNAFGIQMMEEIANRLYEINYALGDFYIFDIKEKYGCLRFYYLGPDIKDIIRKYENLSECTCIRCGHPATKRSTGWISPWCDDCAKEVHDNFVDIIKENLDVK